MVSNLHTVYGCCCTSAFYAGACCCVLTGGVFSAGAAL